MREPHYLVCEAPICSEDPNSDFPMGVLWCPGEEICKIRPLQPYQKQQIIINKSVKKGTRKDMDRHYTAEELARDYLKAQHTKQRRIRGL